MLAAAANAGPPNLHRILIEFHKDIVVKLWGRANHMSARSIGVIAFASALLTSPLLVSVSAKSAFAANCLTAPDSAPPANSHWYYRTDRTEQRKCWYLRGDKESQEQSGLQTARTIPEPLSSVSAPGAFSLQSFKNFLAQQEGTKLSDREVERLYADFLEWNSRTRN
jgi:hypothetical protein